METEEVDSPLEPAVASYGGSGRAEPAFMRETEENAEPRGALDEGRGWGGNEAEL